MGSCHLFSYNIDDLAFIDSLIILLFLTLEAPIITAADGIQKYFFIVFQRKSDLMFISESSVRQRIHMKKIKPYFLRKKSKKLKCRLLRFLFGALRVNI